MVNSEDLTPEVTRTSRRGFSVVYAEYPRTGYDRHGDGSSSSSKGTTRGHTFEDPVSMRTDSLT